jgi:hypothetical protein
MATEKTCFVIAPIGEPESETRKRSDQILKHIVAPAAKECGYEAMRADHISEPGIITSQVIQHIAEDPLVLADLTDRNPNVFYELAIRHAIKKPLVQIIKKGEAIPFDVAGTRTVHVDHHDLDSVEEAKTEIVKQIKSVEKDASQVDTPISVALDLQLLKHSENPEQRSLADMLQAISELRSRLLSIDKRLSDPKALIPPELIEALSRRAGRSSPQSREYMHELLYLTEKLDDVIYGKRTPPEVEVSEKARELFRRMRMIAERMMMEE